MSVSYKVELTDFAISNLTTITSRRVYKKIKDAINLLETSPYLSRVYDPNYEADQPPFECRWIPVPDTPFVIYMIIDDMKQLVTVIFIANHRRDPKTRFQEVESN